MNTFHHAGLDSPRIQKLIGFLQSRREQGATTIEICHACNSTRATSDLSEMAAAGQPYEKFFEGTNENGRKVFRYRLAQLVGEQKAMAKL